MPTSVVHAPRPSSLADVLDLILDKGLVIDAYVRVSLAGIELLTVDARIVIASVDTYLRFAEAVNRLDLTQTESGGLPEVLRQGGRGDEDGNESGRGGHEDAGPGDRRRRRAAPALSRSSHSGDKATTDKDDEAAKGDGPHGGTAQNKETKDDGGGGVLSRLVDRARFE